ncbi:hypothetical protein EVAR_17684_1 [Eumeta japonica]|uniref:Uncharacterized protein n=1 Tax=Eumeta variegata TaxID=151549 RepID=A0A4C1UT29_EUMVA|nr:hypothetical protein EVAR_17684_1 [Eumeta japonica]
MIPKKYRTTVKFVALRSFDCLHFRCWIDVSWSRLGQDVPRQPLRSRFISNVDDSPRIVIRKRPPPRLRRAAAGRTAETRKRAVMTGSFLFHRLEIGHESVARPRPVYAPASASRRYNISVDRNVPASVSVSGRLLNVF